MSDQHLFAVTIPKWGMSMDEGTVVEWLIPVGGPVMIGTQLVEIESTKAAAALEARHAGVLLRQIAKNGAVLPIGAIIGVIGTAAASEADIDSFVTAAHQSASSVEASRGVTPTAIAVAGQPINVVDFGTGATPVVLVHGFGGMLQSWSMIHDNLAQDHRVIAFDLPGHGDTGLVPSSWALSDLAVTINQLLDALGIERAHLVGHSMGGALSGLAALASPKRVASLTLISSMGFGEEINSGYINGFLKAKRPREYEAVLQNLFFHVRYVNRQMIDDIIRMKRIDGITGALQNIAQAAFPNGHQPPLDFSRSLPTTGVPIQLIWGAEDAIVPLWHASGAGLPLTVVQEAGHMPHVEQPAAVAARIRTFIADQT